MYHFFPLVVFTNNVALTVTRQGSTGSMMVRWSTGVQLAGAANGSITPASGSVTSSPGQTTSTLTFTVRNLLSDRQHGVLCSYTNAALKHRKFKTCITVLLMYVCIIIVLIRS